MAFTQITVTGGPFLGADDQPAQGTITATLSQAMVNGTEQIDPTPIVGTLNVAGMLVNDSGDLPFTLAANDDPGTSPSDPCASYEFVLELDVTTVDPFSAVVSHTAAGGTVDLSVLSA